MNPRLKKIIFDKLYNDLKHTEIIPYEDSIWIIDRENKYWYLEYKKRGILYWRWWFFSDFFTIFSMERNEFEPILSSFVEDILNYKVDTPRHRNIIDESEVEDVLNHKVEKTLSFQGRDNRNIDNVLDYKIEKPVVVFNFPETDIEDVLNHKVEKNRDAGSWEDYKVEEILNHKSKT
jgi:hypothetical protein